MRGEGDVGSQTAKSLVYLFQTLKSPEQPHFGVDTRIDEHSEELGVFGFNFDIPILIMIYLLRTAILSLATYLPYIDGSLLDDSDSR